MPRRQHEQRQECQRRRDLPPALAHVARAKAQAIGVFPAGQVREQHQSEDPHPRAAVAIAQVPDVRQDHGVNQHRLQNGELRTVVPPCRASCPPRCSNSNGRVSKRDTGPAAFPPHAPMASGDGKAGSALGLLLRRMYRYRWTFSLALALVACHTLAQSSNIAVLPPQPPALGFLTRPYRRGLSPPSTWPIPAAWLP